jgi:hypothetical protein
MSKKKNGVIIIVLVSIIVVLLGALVFVVYGGSSNLAAAALGKTSISELFHSQIDPVYPDFIHGAEVDCTEVNGEWYDTSSRVGCFDVPEWDSSMCNGVTIILLRNACEGIEGADWVCDQHQAGCYYD